MNARNIEHIRLVHSQPEEAVQIMPEMRKFWDWRMISLLVFVLAFDATLLYFAVKGILK